MKPYQTMILPRFRGVPGLGNKLILRETQILQFTIDSKLQYLKKRNRRATASLSPVLIHFHSPSSFLYRKLQELLQQDQTQGSNTLLPPITNRHPGPAKPRYELPPEEWPTVLRRVVENQEPLRKVADDYGVSYETMRRTIRAARKQGKAG